MRIPIVHKLKILPQYFDEVSSLNKSFEIRKDDRDYQIGDWVLFEEFADGEYTGRKFGCVQISYILRNVSEYGLADGYCIFCW